MFRALLPVVLTILILLGLYALFRSLRPDPKKRRFTGPSFDRLRREGRGDEIDGGKLHRDPVSGTYVAEHDAVVLEIRGRKYYFSSQENAEQFKREQG